MIGVYEYILDFNKNIFFRRNRYKVIDLVTNNFYK